jgi:hypothetical protein
VSLHHAPWLLRELLSITGVDQLLQVTEESDEASTDTPV